MTLLRVGTGIYVAADDIVLLQTYPSRPSRRDKQTAEAAGLYKDATTSGKKREPLRTLVHLGCGLVVGSAIGADALANRSPISAPVKRSTRRNDIEGAQIVGAPAPALPVEHPQPAPKPHEAEPDDDPDKDEPAPKPRGLRRLMRRGQL